MAFLSIVAKLNPIIYTSGPDINKNKALKGMNMKIAKRRA